MPATALESASKLSLVTSHHACDDLAERRKAAETFLLSGPCALHRSLDATGGVVTHPHHERDARSRWIDDEIGRCVPAGRCLCHRPRGCEVGVPNPSQPTSQRCVVRSPRTTAAKSPMTLRLTLLGGFEARVADGPPVAFARKKAQALLAYLALLPGRAQPRDK